MWVASLVAIWSPKRFASVEEKLVKVRTLSPILYKLVGIIGIFIPAVLFFFTPYGTYFRGDYLRLYVLLICSLVFAYGFTVDQKRLLNQKQLSLGILLSGSIHLTANYLSSVTNYPFALFWSEGNRLYDYSLYFGRNRYINSDITSDSVGSPGRHMLWGLVFLIPNSPIWVHRLWDALLWIIPPIAVGYSLTRYIRAGRPLKWMFVLWCFLFLSQGPIYAPLLLAAVVIFAVTSNRYILLTLIAVLLITYYVIVSRYTWLISPVAWAIIILVNKTDFRTALNQRHAKKFFTLIGLLLFSGFIVATMTLPGLKNPVQFVIRQVGHQPLLWQRLLPNETYPEGIMLGLLIASGALMIILAWLVLTRRWATHWVQKLVNLVAFTLFLTIGLVVSVKIGGGSNLHNLDMFLITLVLFAALAFDDFLKAKSLQPLSWINVLFLFAILFPSWNAVRSGKPLNLPEQTAVQQTLELINNKINKRIDKGEILFLDQRQLLTFHFVTPVPLIQEYEKKDMMNKAMAGDEDYFKNFYQDLVSQRFSLIITDPLFENIQDADYRFDEENNAWVKWVATPLMCYYAPIYTNGDIYIQLLVARSSPQNCPD